jgi:hypothetical protein
LTPRPRLRHLDSSLDFDGGLDTSMAASHLDSSLEHLNGGLDTSTAASTSTAT